MTARRPGGFSAHDNKAEDTVNRRERGWGCGTQPEFHGVGTTNRNPSHFTPRSDPGLGSLQTERSNAMASLKTSRRGARITILGMVLSIASIVPAAFAGGNVLPPNAKPHGTSLSDMVGQAALFFASGNNLTFYPDTPFQILYLKDGPLVFEVRPGTMLYIPLFFSDDSPPVIGNFPDVGNQSAVADYYFNQDQLGVTIAEIQVDGGEVTTLGRGYAAGAETPPLPDGGGTHMTVLAAFISPLDNKGPLNNKGIHTVRVRALLTGEAWRAFNGGTLPPGLDVTFTVIVR
jgi:hypothetical protein